MTKEKPDRIGPGVFTEAAQMARAKYEAAKLDGASVVELARLREDLCD